MNGRLIAAVRVPADQRHVDEQGGADGDQDVRAQTGGVLTVLTLKADERTQHEGNHERNEDVVGNGGHGGACGGW